MYDECAVYQPFLNASKPQIQLEYADRLAALLPKPKPFTSCGATQEGVGKALYPTTKINSAQISMSCPE
jgi:hypothetical protein